MFGRKDEKVHDTREIGLLGIDTRFEGTIRFVGTLRIDGAVVGNISSEPGSGSVLIVNQEATVHGDIVSDSVVISGRVEGNVHARNRVEIFRSGILKGDVFTNDIMIEGGAEFRGYCHMIEERAPGDAGGGGSEQDEAANRGSRENPGNGADAAQASGRGARVTRATKAAEALDRAEDNARA